MSYRVAFKPAALRELQKLPRSAFARVLPQLFELADRPRPTGVKKMVGAPSGMLRLRVGDYRVVYHVDDDADMIAVYRVGHRRDVYEA